MGKLSTVQIPTKEVPLPDGQSLTVRGLNLGDLLFLLGDQAPLMKELFDEFMRRAEEEDITLDVTRELFFYALQKAPGLVFGALALANDEYTPEAIEIAKKMPTTTLVIIFEAILQMSISTDAELKKSVEIVSSRMGKLRAIAAKINLPSR